MVSDVGRRVAELRAALGLTQAELAERLGIGAKHEQRIELAEFGLTVRSLARIAIALGVPIAALFDPPTTPKRRPGRPRRKPSRKQASGSSATKAKRTNRR